MNSDLSATLALVHWAADYPNASGDINTFALLVISLGEKVQSKNQPIVC